MVHLAHRPFVELRQFEDAGTELLRADPLRRRMERVEARAPAVVEHDHVADLRAEVVGGGKPLGAILNESGLPYASRPGGFLKIPGETFQPDFFPTAGSKFLFGRYNTLLDAKERVLARIIEILPREKS